MSLRIAIMLVLLFLCAQMLPAQPGTSEMRTTVCSVRGTTLFESPDAKGIPHRIPAIACTPWGTLVAVGDYRYCKNDIGYGQIDLRGRISQDGGDTWGEAFTVAHGSGVAGADDCGFGDAAIVADRESDLVLLMCVAGNITFWNSARSNPQLCARLLSRDGGRTWGEPQFLQEQILALFDHRDSLPPLDRFFISSGKMCQSRLVKKGRFFRIYAAICTDQGSYALFSDDLGEHWQVLGSANCQPAPHGDEAKCEELPDGSVMLSCRKQGGGRYLNVFTYSDVAAGAGSWGKPVDTQQVASSFHTGDNACNGEALIVEAVRTSDRRKVHLLLQSLPAADGRARVTIFYKELASATDFDTPEHLASNWTGGYEVTPKMSAYSTMCLQKDNAIAFFYEEEPGDYCLVYKKLTIKEITGGKYE